MRIDVGHKSDDRQELAFKRCLPSIGVGTVDRGQIGVLVGITEEDIAGSWNLSRGERAKEQHNNGRKKYPAHQGASFYIPNPRACRKFLDAQDSELVATSVVQNLQTIPVDAR